MATADRIGDIRSHVWPDDLQLLLLRATLGAGLAAQEAWEAWRRKADLDAVDCGSYRLLPALFQALRARGVEDPWMGRLRGIHHHTWCRNHTLLSEAGKLIAVLHRQGIETILLKGAALVLGYLPSMALRPMDDVDVLVRPETAARAHSLLVAQGWTPDRGDRDFSLLRARYSSCGFTSPCGAKVDLHWQLHKSEEETGDSGAWWTCAGRGVLGSVPVRLPHPSHLLAHVLIHGLSLVHVPTIHWIPDAVAILRHTRGRFDWDPLVTEAGRVRVSPFVRDALRWLAREFGVPVSRGAVARLGAKVLPLRIRLLYLAKSRPSPIWPAIYEAVPWPGLAAVRRRGALRYLEKQWDLASPTQLPAAACRWASRKLRRLLSDLDARARGNAG